MNSLTSLNMTQVKSAWCRIYQSQLQDKQQIIYLRHFDGCTSFFIKWTLPLLCLAKLMIAQYSGYEKLLTELLIHNMEQLIDGLTIAERQIISHYHSP